MFGFVIGFVSVSFLVVLRVRVGFVSVSFLVRVWFVSGSFLCLFRVRFGSGSCSVLIDSDLIFYLVFGFISKIISITIIMNSDLL